MLPDWYHGTAAAITAEGADTEPPSSGSAAGFASAARGHGRVGFGGITAAITAEGQ